VLDERKAAILKAVVEEYIETALPVGSSSVTRATGVSVSSATVRNELASLESDGYLQQPHTSAGRVPTERGYRYFVDSVGTTRLARPESRQVLDFFSDVRGEIEDLLRETVGLLSDLTDHAAVIVDHSIEGAVVRSVQLVPLSEAVVLVVVVLSNGVVEKHTLEFDQTVDDDRLDRIAAAVRDAVDGKSPAEAAALAPTGDQLADKAAQRVMRALGAGSNESERVFVEGTSRVAGGFEALDSVHRVLTILEQQLVVVDLIADVLDRGMNVAIGTETGLERLEECSVVVSPYQIDGQQAGSIAVLGPTRMNYPQAMAAVAVISRQLGNRLSEG